MGINVPYALLNNYNLTYFVISIIKYHLLLRCYLLLTSYT